MKHFIYIHRNPTTNEIFYVGQGTTHQGRFDRAYSKKSRSIWWNNYVSKYGYPIVEVVISNIDKETADIKEKELILRYGRRDINEGTLVNLTDGGDGTGERSEEYCAEHSIRMSGENHPMWGKKHNEEWINNNSKSHLGKKLSEETRKKMSESRKGLKRSEETKRKMSQSSSGEKNGMYGRTGEKNPASKLTWEIVEEIRNLYKEGNTSIRKLSKKYGVSNITIENVIKHRTWVNK